MAGLSATITWSSLCLGTQLKGEGLVRRGIRIMQIRLAEAVMRGYRGGEDIERYKAGKTVRLSEHLKLKREEKGLERTLT